MKGIYYNWKHSRKQIKGEASWKEGGKARGGKVGKYNIGQNVTR